jgi:hypothetical protein
MNLLNVLLHQGSAQFFQGLLQNEVAMIQLADIALQEDLDQRHRDSQGNLQANFEGWLIDLEDDEHRKPALAELYYQLSNLPAVNSPENIRMRRQMVQVMLGELPCCATHAVRAEVWRILLDSILRAGEWNESLSLIAATGVLNRPITVVRVSARVPHLLSCFLLMCTRSLGPSGQQQLQAVGCLQLQWCP